ncbi:MAG: amylo-alpha-1,6-glucosidase [Thiobacillus sp.]|nr:amylo-alpha-1,6-glucosidase [Thiobacillus sp.]
MSTPLPAFIRFGREICGDLAQAEHREWWLADGYGGYAAGTIAQSLTRRYHGLLFDADPATLARRLLFSKAEVVLIDGEHRYPLTTNHWASGAIEPSGFRLIESFRLEGSTPVWRFEIADIVVEQRIWFVPGSRTLCLAWNLVHPLDRPIALEIALLCNDRDHHGETCASDRADLSADMRDGRLCLLAGSEPRLFFASAHGQFRADATWYRDFFLPLEHARGLPEREDHFRAGYCHLDLRPNQTLGLTASRDSQPSSINLDAALRQRQAYDGNHIQHAALCAHGYADTPDWVLQLLIDSDRFLVHRATPHAAVSPPTELPYWNDRSELFEGAAVVAGYPWFADWGRDTFIALPGLTLATGRYVVARRILESWAHHMKDGLLPNLLPEDGADAEYNSADAALWYIEAWRAYYQYTQDLAAVRHVLPVLKSIIDGYTQGTHFGIGLDPADGLMRAGEPGSQVTWMDARVDGMPATPRIGKPVELNALWYNALRVLEKFVVLFGEDAAPYASQAERMRASFACFVQPNGSLFDVLDGPDGNEAQLRPNQILAVSLTYSPLDPTAQKQVVRHVAQHLLTSYGLRTLALFEPGYRPRYQGGVRERDSGYHQGPVWAWLLGHYALAEYRVSGNAAQARSLLEPLRDHLQDAGLGSISELFDGDAPHCSRGAPCQAWSVACTLYAWHWLTCALEKQHRITSFPPSSDPTSKAPNAKASL